MKLRYCYTSTLGVTLVTLGLAAGAIAPYLATTLTPALAASPENTSFPDTQNYWAQPFIHNLAERDIVTGYPDNTFRPEQPVARDEFASILQQAFSQPAEREIASGSVYTDVPQGYWAAPAIQEAYEMGFMKGYPGGEFRPNQPVSRVEVLVSLAQNLNLPTTTTAVDKSVAAAATPARVQPVSRRRANRPLIFPLAMTTLMQPLMATPARATAAANSAPASSNTSQRPVSLVVSDYYQDAAQIPQYAVDDVAATTAAGIVVNYPDQRVLNPTRPATRGEVAALIHQALVSQGKTVPISDQSASQYVVGR
ncbi:S-layer homology domain-containing protein [Phormidium sp. CLA17]|uniref:S-layer homology domain-containing protein n=1 Tax=Leptolyngbya sp. Cla-17 TaxID=2803751 RepID=UPI0014924050|nr:S-layer homology domain-containing protein [Leptolyngbya sp. Cla-17]MBM0744234.1 S-layer homology domain-containing protein [Leptolyngbya sp. Cla-17]